VSQCQACQQREAVVHLTQIANGEVTTMHLCSKCAAERGIETEAAVTQSPLGAFLAAMGTEPVATDTEAEPDRCPACGATLQDFRASGRMGCAECWTTFEAPLRDLLRRVHGATRHVGRTDSAKDASAREAGGGADRRSELREQLRLAILAEEFERAAQLRDQLRVLDE